uniref:Palmitoyltransferase n=1 Tax=Phallusia mammillata TaxID=59560 RepID=A0A6F9DY55_9ASCI|nr:putative palmitoyltransferase ZDHHC1 [Phallusia mammillata]
MCRYNGKRAQTGDTGEKFPRINGWHLPLNGLQILAWGVEAVCALMTFGVEIIALPASSWPAAYACMGVGYVVHLTFLIVATTINPVDDNAEARINNVNGPMPKFDRSQHRHVIENNYCHICEVPVGVQSKHCSACNKCVAVFDHHCKWLNNCVGKKNYRAFLVLIFTGLIESIGMMVISLLVFINAVQGFQWLNQDVWWSSSSTNNATQITFEVFIAIKMILVVLIIILLLQLFSFHMLLVYRNMTTYEYIKKSMAKTDRKKTDQQTAPPPSMENGTICNDPLDSTGVNEEANSSTPRHTNVKAVSEIVDKDIPKHALLKGNKGTVYNTTDNTGTHTHLNNTYVNDESVVVSARVNFSNILNTSNNSNQLQTELAVSATEERDLPHTVPDANEVNSSIV